MQKVSPSPKPPPLSKTPKKGFWEFFENDMVFGSGWGFIFLHCEIGFAIGSQKSPFSKFFWKGGGTSATAAGDGVREHKEWPRSKSARLCADAPAAIFGYRNRIV